MAKKVVIEMLGYLMAENVYIGHKVSVVSTSSSGGEAVLNWTGRQLHLNAVQNIDGGTRDLLVTDVIALRSPITLPTARP